MELWGKTVSIITLTLLLTGMLTLAFNIQPVESDYIWTETIGIMSDGSIYPDTAPISSADNVTYTLTDNIAGNVPEGFSAISIGRNNIVIDGAGFTVEGTGAYSSKGIGLVEKSNVTIKNTQVNGFERGIYLSGSNYSKIQGNTVTNNTFGVQLGWSSNCVVSGNTFVNDGLYMGYSSYENVVVNNSVNSKPLVYLEKVSDYAVGDAGQVVLVNCTAITVKNLNLSNTAIGVQLLNTNNTNIARNDITNNFIGILMDYSSSNSIQENNITNNMIGIGLQTHDHANIIQGNMIANNTGGLWLVSSSNNHIQQNDITHNEYGFSLAGASNNSITGNNITYSHVGIRLGGFPSYDNVIYHNNFIGNAQVKNETSYDIPLFKPLITVWDDSYPSGGNYWSNYTGVDEKSGPNQDQPGSDGIWDHPYIIDENNTDRYPLVNPWSPALLHVQGLDVSHYQGDINWTQVYGAGYRFAFVKATGGVSFIDPNFTANMEQASEAGLIVGAYHFAYPEYNDAVSEAQHFLSVAGNYMKIGYLRPVLDLEDDPEEGSYPYRMGKDNLSNWIHTWMNTVKNETGIEPIIYTGWYARVGDYLDDSIAEYDLWIANWTYDPAISPDTGIWDSWDFWQYSNKGSVPGIAGDVDLDLFNGNVAKLYYAFIISNVKLFNVVWENKTYPMAVFSNSTVTHLVFNQPQAQISLNITGTHGSKGYCNITIPKDLLKGLWTYTMDGETPSVIDISEGENATHSFIYFTYIHASTFRITIQGAWVVPEFPSTIILPLFMLTTLIVTVLLKKKRKAKPQLP